MTIGIFSGGNHRLANLTQLRNPQLAPHPISIRATTSENVLDAVPNMSAPVVANIDAVNNSLRGP
jgi:hypothetical protein